MTASELRRLNKTFECFGRLPDGRLRLRWFRTEDLHYHIEKEHKVSEITTPAGLYTVSTEWEQHSWAERLGPGWILALWRPPISRDQHVARYGSMAPYNPNGEYQIIENTHREPWDEPQERHTELLKDLAMKQIDLLGIDFTERKQVKQEGYTAIRDTLQAQQEKKFNQTRSQIEDEIDDLAFPFNHVPGTRGGHVSFGGL